MEEIAMQRFRLFGAQTEKLSKLTKTLIEESEGTGTIKTRKPVTPNNITRHYTYEAKRDLIATLSDKRGTTAVVNRSYEYNALNRPVTYTRENANGTQTVITADYDYMGRRVFKKVETVTPAAPDSESGEETRTIHTHHRYLYRGYLQIATLDLTRSTLNELWLITWDPTQTVATRPLAIQKDGTWYYAPARPAAQGTPSQVCSGLGVWLLKPHPAYGLDLPKNITEVYGFDGYIKATYTYTPYGLVTSTGNTSQPIQWSSEFTDTDLGLVYYNYRHYNPLDGRWTGRDLARTSEAQSLYCYIRNVPVANYDIGGLIIDTVWDIGNVIWDVGTIAYGAATGDSEMVLDGTTDLAMDALAMLIPGVPAGASKVARAAAKKAAKKSGKKANRSRTDKRIKNFGNCTKERHSLLQKTVGKLCKSEDRKISCKGKCLSCDEMSVRIANGLACIAAREAINMECFSGGDAPHAKEINNVKTAVQNCETLRISKGC